MGFSSQEYWSGLPFLSPGDLPDPGIEPGSPALQADSLPSESLFSECYLPANARDVRDADFVLGLGRCPGEGNGNPFQYSCVENPMDGEPGGLQSMRSQGVRHD